MPTDESGFAEHLSGWSRGHHTTRLYPAIGSTPATRCACGKSKPLSPLIFRLLISAITTVRWMKKDVLRDFFEMTPEKFSNKTNGVTPRRFMVLSNPGLSDLITRNIGDGWITHLEELRRLETFAEQQDFQSE